MNCRLLWVERVLFQYQALLIKFLVIWLSGLWVHVAVPCRAPRQPTNQILYLRLLLIHSLCSLCLCFGLLKVKHLKAFLSFRMFPPASGWFSPASQGPSGCGTTLQGICTTQLSVVSKLLKVLDPTVCITGKNVNGDHPKTDTWGVEIFNYFKIF